MDAVSAVLFVRRRKNVSESESSSDSDEDWEEILRKRGQRKLRPRIPDYANVVNRYLDYEFKNHFRMLRATFQFLLEIIQNDLIRKVKDCPTVPAHQQLMIALWKMATMDSYRSVCDRFNVGRATAVRAVRRVTHAIFSIASTFIQWPTGDHAAFLMRGFEEASRFPRTIGAIDGTHIRIDAPKENPADYVNRKGFHSIQLQLVCDHRTIITHCFTGYPGSVHDQRIFRCSEVANFLKEEEKFPGDSHILGDAAYELQEHLLTPFRDNGHLTQKQINYNYRHSAARVTIERCIALLKGRMRSLLHCLPMLRVDLMAEYIVTCCVIHNICTLRRDEIAVITILSQENVIDNNVLRETRQNVAIQKRNLIMNSLRIYS